MYFDIIKAEYISDYKLKLVFEDKKSGVVDFVKYLKAGKVFSRFSDINFFRNFYIEDGIISWGEGEIDIAPETLYLMATGLNYIKWDIGELTEIV